MAMNSSGGGGTVLSEINVTPLVDVMLVLLVIFMVTTPLIEQDDEKREVEMDLPVTRDNESRVNLDQTDQIILEIDDNLQIFIGETMIVDCTAALDQAEPQRFEPCFDELQSKVASNQKLQDQGRLYLLGHPDIPYGFVVGAMNRIRLAGVSNVGMVTNPEYRQAEPQ
ncbi:biopolymer transporter ExbD [Lujinxingia sediminis]|uniref:Biopolymer transporter ExbD n=1 Tax=Lujinxingia sediminis TaxID=2480984 RepID=A0ABY0CXU5_9DELT|nr:biopolymer transporter ExbD [Lujinxingia sediminis]RVU48460.1 biopolymer transporter ExbD [Lujinxingia sediminis]